MTVKELLEALKKYPLDTPVLVDGYEGEYELVTAVKEKKVKKKAGMVPWYSGEYDDAKNGTDAVLIFAAHRFESSD